MAQLERQLQAVREQHHCVATVEASSPHMRTCHLSIPWAGRRLHWQILVPTHSGAPDVVFEPGDDSFQPLCPAPQPPPWPAHHLHPAAAGGLAPHHHSPRLHASAALPPLSERLRVLLQALEEEPHRPDGLAALVGLLMEAYQQHQRARLEGAAAGVPRLQFELSTLPDGGADGVQMELLGQQACFALPLPSVDVSRLVEAATQLRQPSSSQHQQQQHQGTAAGRSGQPPQARSNSATDPDDVLEPLDPRDHHPGADAAGGTGGPSAGALHSGGGGSSGASSGGGARRGRPQPLVLTAAFRLPASGAAGGDLSEPELGLQLPTQLTDVASAASSLAPSSGAGAGAGSSALAASGSAAAAPGAVPLLPSLLLPVWTPHMCLAEFLPLATERLQAQIDAHVTLLTSRQQVLSELADMLGWALEVNVPGGAGLFAVAWEGQSVVVSVDLGARFPNEKPLIVLHCARQLVSPECSRSYRDYPWSPRWAPREMAARIHNWLKEELPNFMRGRVPPAVQP